MVICKNGHAACGGCAARLEEECPECRGRLFTEPVVNRPLCAIIDALKIQ